MTERVDFYVLKSSTPRQRLNFACRLTEKAYLRDLKVVVLAADAEHAAALDELLWTFNERSFVPHDVLPGTAAASAHPAPVQLTPDLGGVAAADLLVNMSDTLPPGFERFGRVAEIIDADATRRTRGRERFKAYRELKLPVETHQLDDGAGA